jgi:hypothetical protein
MRGSRGREHSRGRVARRWIFLAAAVLLGPIQSCGSGGSHRDGYSCTATCPGRDAWSYDWCLTSKLQDALDSAGCPAQTQCTATPNACDNLGFP